MSSLLNSLATREQGDFPLSIATSIAIEKLCGVLQDRDADGNKIPTKPVRPPALDYQELWVNVRTLFRNIHGAVERESRDLLSPEQYAMAMNEEIAIVEGLMKEFTKGMIKVQWYTLDYQGRVAKSLTGASIRVPTTDKQVMYHTFEENTVILSAKRNPEIYLGRDNLAGRHDKAIMLSHYAVDLLSVKSFKALSLVESHTGAIKTRAQWNTKLTGGSGLPNMPFCEFTVKVFGDGGNLVRPQGIKVRRTLLQLAEERRWTTVTTHEKMVYGIRHMSPSPERDILLELVTSST